MVYRNLNGTSATSLEIANGKNTSKRLEVTDRGLRVTGTSSESLAPVEVGEPEAEYDAVTLKYFKANSGATGNYLNTLAVTLPDEIKGNPTMVNRRIIDEIERICPSPNKNDYMPVKAVFTPSGTRREMMFQYDGSMWNFKYNSTSDIDTADDGKNGMVRSSADIDFDSGVGKVLHASSADSIAGVPAEKIVTDDTIVEKMHEAAKDPDSGLVTIDQALTNAEIDDIMGIVK